MSVFTQRIVKSGRRLSLTAAIFLVIAAFAAGNLSSRPARPEAPLGNHYLLLATAFNRDSFTPDKIAQFDQSPYEGLAVVFLGAYETIPIPSAARMEAQMKDWKRGTKKDLWPWLFLNRMVGPDPAQPNPRGQVPYYLRIKGLDLEGTTGAQKDFLEYWQNALKAAKNTGTPGVFLDLEFYLNYAGYNVVKLAAQMNKPPAEVAALLRQLGGKMAEIAHREHPGATLWLLFTDLDDPDFAKADGQSFYPSPAYIVMGMMDVIQARHYSLRVISGGEVGIGYCHTTLDQLKMKIRNRAKDFQLAMQSYSQVLELGGTLAPWSDKAEQNEWMKEGFCGSSSAQNAEQLVPYLETIMRTYRYNWIYGTVQGNYWPFRPQSAPRFDAMIRKAEIGAYGAASH